MSLWIDSPFTKRQALAARVSEEREAERSSQEITATRQAQLCSLGMLRPALRGSNQLFRVPDECLLGAFSLLGDQVSLARISTVCRVWKRVSAVALGRLHRSMATSWSMHRASQRSTVAGENNTTKRLGGRKTVAAKGFGKKSSRRRRLPPKSAHAKDLQKEHVTII